jgi:hypothetical protein
LIKSARSWPLEGSLIQGEIDMAISTRDDASESRLRLRTAPNRVALRSGFQIYAACTHTFGIARLN